MQYFTNVSSSLTICFNKLRERSEEEVRRFRTENSISIVSGQEKAPKPTLAFDEVGFPKEILSVLAVRIIDAAQCESDCKTKDACSTKASF